MKRFIVVLCLIVSVCALGFPAQLQAGWDLHYLTDDGGQRTGCFITGSYQDGTRVSLVVMKDYSYALGLHNSTWGLKAGTKIDVRAFVRRPVADGKAIVLKNGTKPFGRYRLDTDWI